jgi:putative tricarboxylic transport membrane protein
MGFEQVGLDFLVPLFFHTLTFWWIIIPALALGLLIGAIPGFGAPNTLIIMLPFTLAVDLDIALVFMVTIYASARMGAGIPAILVNIPGTAGAAATVLDGYPMSKKGMAQPALVLSFAASAVGGLITSVLSLFALPVLSQVGYYLHSIEMIVVMFFGITLIALIASRDTLKALVAGFFGLLIGAIGPDYVYSTPRGTFGFIELYDGVPVVAALIGLFGISEALVMIEEKLIVTKEGKELAENAGWPQVWEGIAMALKRWWHIVWTSFSGLIVGIIPGAGAPIAAFVAYQQSRQFSKTPEKYGTGHPEGILAPESANNGVTAGSLIPLLTIGVPGGGTAAIMLIVLQYHGVIFGPKLFMDSPEIPYGVMMAMVVTYLFMIGTIIPLSRYMSRVVLVPTQYLAPIIIAFTLVGAFAPRQFLFDMNLALIFGVIGYICRKTNYHVAALLIGVILGPFLEEYVIRGYRIKGGDPLFMFTSTLGNVLWVLLAISLATPYLLKAYRSRTAGTRQ